MTKLIARAACLALSLASIPAAATEGFPSHDFFRNQWGGLNLCSRATTDVEVEWCAGQLPASSPANPGKFDCRKAEVDVEYMYCGKQPPKRRR